MSTTGSVRLRKELAALKTTEVPGFTKLDVDEANLLQWSGLLVPDKEPYNVGAYKIRLEFPREYPFKPPLVSFATKIYHPNVEESGKMCFPLIAPENWKPSTKIQEVIQALVELVNQPNADHPQRADAAQLLLKDKPGFIQKAKDEARQFAEKRP